MKTSDFDIQIPRGLIAQEPVSPRDYSKLMVLPSDGSLIVDSRFYDLPKFLQKGDCLVFNNSRVIPARLRGNISGEPMSEVVIVLLYKDSKGDWGEALAEVGEVKFGDKIDFTVLWGSSRCRR
jgi:S-adenosylmethionine:tRNA ribosyltransferase-isomerase